MSKQFISVRTLIKAIILMAFLAFNSFYSKAQTNLKESIPPPNITSTIVADTVICVPIKGIVIARGDKLPVPTAIIIAKGTRIGAQSLQDGTFSLSVPDTCRAITVKFISYKTQEVDLLLYKKHFYKVILEDVETIRCGRFPFFKRIWYYITHPF